LRNNFSINIIRIVNNKIIKTLFIVLLIFAVYFQFNKINANDSVDLKIVNSLYFLIAFIFFIYTLLAHVLTWHILINSLGGKIRFRNSIYIYFISGLLRYLPGNYWYIFSRSAMGLNLGIDMSKNISGTSLEILLNLLMGISLSLVGVLWGIELEIKQLSWILVFFIVCSILLILLLVIGKKKINSSNSIALSKAVIFFHDICKLKNLPFWKVCFLLFLFLSIWIAQGFSLFFVLSAFIPLNFSFYPLVMFSYVISWVIGFINPITPNGLGIREALLMITLTPTISTSVALGASIIMRLLGLAGESILAFLGWISSRGTRQSKECENLDQKERLK